jgi:predicted nucleic acid-binding protein
VINAVIDTNILVSAAIKPRGEAGRIIVHLRYNEFTLLYSGALLEELVADLPPLHISQSCLRPLENPVADRLNSLFLTRTRPQIDTLAGAHLAKASG